VFSDAIDICANTPSGETGRAQWLQWTVKRADNDGVQDAIDICLLTTGNRRNRDVKNVVQIPKRMGNEVVQML